MGEGTEVSRDLPDASWRPDVDSFEWYSRWALHSMAPCDYCSQEYRDAYARLQGTVDAADSCFRLGYQLYSELTRIENQGTHEPETNTD